MLQRLVRKFIKCGKGCKNCPHGPYWYLTWKEYGRQRWEYVGRELPDHLQEMWAKQEREFHPDRIIKTEPPVVLNLAEPALAEPALAEEVKPFVYTMEMNLQDCLAILDVYQEDPKFGRDHCRKRAFNRNTVRAWEAFDYLCQWFGWKPRRAK